MRGRADESEATKEGRQREVAQRKGEREVCLGWTVTDTGSIPLL